MFTLAPSCRNSARCAPYPPAARFASVGSNPSSFIDLDVGCIIKGYCNYFKHLETNNFLTLACQSHEFYPFTQLPTGSYHESRGSRAAQPVQPVQHVQPVVPLLKASAPHRWKSQGTPLRYQSPVKSRCRGHPVGGHPCFCLYMETKPSSTLVVPKYDIAWQRRPVGPPCLKVGIRLFIHIQTISGFGTIGIRLIKLALSKKTNATLRTVGLKWIEYG